MMSYIYIYIYGGDRSSKAKQVTYHEGRCTLYCEAIIFLHALREEVLFHICSLEK